MTSKELRDMLLNIDDDTKINVVKELPIAISDIAHQYAVLYSDNINDENLLEQLRSIFMMGYITCKAEQRIVLDETFLN